MANSPIPVELRKFIVRYISSVEHVEILCLLAENPGRAWSEAEVFRSIQSSPESVSKKLRYFASEGFLKLDGTAGYVFAPETEVLAGAARALVKTYRERRVAVVEAIYTPSVDALQEFADAFRIRKEKP